MGGRIARLSAAIFALTLVCAPPAFARTGKGVLEAGAAAVDASWHVGASAGQYASSCDSQNNLQANRCSFIGDHGVDPTSESTRRASSYGIQSRLSIRAIVIQGPAGNRYAIVKNDLYIPQDLLYRGTAQILAADNQGPDPSKRSGISADTLTMAVTHDHSSPYYSSPSWGVWTFQDVFDVRFYEYYAQQMAKAVELAAQRLRPARVGAEVVYLDKPQRHSFGPQTADDGTPAGYPQQDTDHGLTVLRFDTTAGRPIGVLVNYGLHGEGLNGNDLISADWVAPMQRVIDRETGALAIFTQNATGTTEMARDGTGHPYSQFLHQRLEFAHKEYAQSDWAGHLIGDAVVGAWREIGAGTPSNAQKYVPFMSGDVTFASRDAWYPGPLSHAYPGVSSCRTQPALAGNPRLPVVGLPDCQSAADFFGFPGPPALGVSTGQLEQAGIPIPENYSAPSYTGLEENVDVHLQALRIGDILLTVCSCEQWKDQSANIKSRTDQTSNNEYWGFDWTDPSGAHTNSFDPYWTQYCTRNGDGSYGDYSSVADPYGNGTWNCPTATGNPNRGQISDQLIQHMRAQVRNPANGWNLAQNVAWAESERIGTNAKGQQTFDQIAGNFTHDDGCGPRLDQPCAPGEQSPSARYGYKLTVTIGMANDYNGYIASYREYQRGDHYRKALTGWGPHSSDYMATRLVTLGRELKAPDVGAPWRLPAYEQDLNEEASNPALQAKLRADVAKNDQEAAALGRMGQAAIAGYTAALPADGGAAGPVSHPR
ncbi:MAG TPA: neutral/alkaline non-lysosomal ceramidase N-terminal domain-containing protein, partial [Solirubrobacteraceae bacterium]|nr:neutral/alkaline non-lysosomal ceramidase N-terminal domain-containing protein [Solirubrobacteraceae bacterium]